MKTNPQKVLLAHQLQVEGKSSREISAITGIPRGSLWSCLHNFGAKVQTTRKPTDRSHLSEVTRTRHARQRELWEIEMDATGRSLPVATGDLLFFLGLGLYWAEGSKNERKAITFSNSDPSAIRAYIAFLREVGADSAKLCAGLVIHEDVDRNEARDFWSHISGIAPERIYISQIESQGNSGKRSRGVLNVIVSDMEFSRRLFGWLRGISRQFAEDYEIRPLLEHHTR